MYYIGGGRMKIIQERYADDYVALPSKVRNQANKIINKYNGWHFSKEIPPMYKELEDIGITVGMVQNKNFDYTDDINGAAEVYYNGERVDNAIFIYQVYRPVSHERDEYNMYIS